MSSARHNVSSTILSPSRKSKSAVDGNGVRIFFSLGEGVLLAKFGREICQNDSLSRALSKDELSRPAGVYKAMIVFRSYRFKLAELLESRGICDTSNSKLERTLERCGHDLQLSFKHLEEKYFKRSGMRRSNRIPVSKNDPEAKKLIKNAGEASQEAVIELQREGAVHKVHSKFSASHYPQEIRGVRKCHLRALYNVSQDLYEKARELRHDQTLEVKRILNGEENNTGGSVHRLRQQHWVSLTPDLYTDDKYYHRVIDFNKAQSILKRLEQKKGGLL